MQTRDNPNVDADIPFLRDQLRLAEALAKRGIEFGIIPLMSCGEKQAKVNVSISKALQKEFLK